LIYFRLNCVKMAVPEAKTTGLVNILIVDDHEASADAMAELLADEGYSTYTAKDAEIGLTIVDEEAIDVVIADLVLPGVDGIDFLMMVKERWPEVPVIILTGYGSIETAVEATKRGAYEYLTKPVDFDKLSVVVNKALERRGIEIENRRLRAKLYDRYSFDKIIGKSKPMQEIYEIISRIAPTDASVLVSGESGTGKELIADAIHYNSRRREKPFVKINCAALAEGVLESELFGHEKGAFTGAIRRHRGVFEQADGGTLFLDEISEIPLPTQVKLLRVLQDGIFRRVGGDADLSADVRVIAATNVDLAELAGEKKFREDLYYRLKVVTIRVPPLRDRTEDIPLLVDAFIKEFAAKNKINIKGISDEALWLLRVYPWPGNIRELRNVVESMVVMADGKTLTGADVPPEIKRAASDDSGGVRVGMTVAEVERYIIEKTLDEVDGNRTRASQILGIGLRTLQRKLKQYAEEDREPVEAV
jgi:DNA-binding NtrC family response regulator